MLMLINVIIVLPFVLDTYVLEFAEWLQSKAEPHGVCRGSLDRAPQYVSLDLNMLETKVCYFSCI
jgi:hypothetical protein